MPIFGWDTARAPCCNTCCYRLGCSERLDERHGDAKSISELAKMTHADPVLMNGSWYFSSLGIVCSLVKAEKLSRTVIEGSSSDG